ncbi:UNVERIFIED_CONTAM: hypothetical protein GTU68_046732 [Idotea baltica]|nr:hypothetical protein [Idotea baltica]
MPRLLRGSAIKLKKLDFQKIFLIFRDSLFLEEKVLL